MIWKSTKYIGVGVAWDSNGKVVIVAHYKPAGNIAGYFAENVSVIDPIKHSGKIGRSILDRPSSHRTGFEILEREQGILKRTQIKIKTKYSSKNT